MELERAARLCALSIRDFRNLERVDLEPPAVGFLLTGENGQGKTNLLEAIYYCQIIRSIRGARDKDLVRFGAAGFHIAARFESDRAGEVAIGFERVTGRKRVRVDGVICDRLSEAVGALPAVMFSPADVDLVAGSPASRRRYLDIMLAVTSRGYLHALQRYRAALVRRNAALRDAVRHPARDAARVEIWEEPLAEHGALLVTERRAWLDGTRERFTQLCRAIGEEAQVDIRYMSTVAPANATDSSRGDLARAFEQQRAADMRFGLTRNGPHRDDLLITLEIGTTARDLRVFGSAGQQRTAAIALRLVEAETLRDRRGVSPLFLLDDPFAELDARRAIRIVELLSREQLGQTVLAVPRDSDIPSGMQRLERFSIAAGAVRRE
jgi:DNA replication and repair protein RecF